ncbi:MAG: hypothetical protein EZS28_023121, partial [Streblomastix strix]
MTETLRSQIQAGGDIKSQIIHHSTRLRLRETSDSEKIKSLTELLILIIASEQGEWREIVGESGIIESLSGLMLETANPRIRTLSGSVIQLVQQIGTESTEQTDWRTLLSPLISLLFNPDQQISNSGKQSLLQTIGVKQEALLALVDIGLIEQGAETLDLTLTSQQSSSSSQSSSYPDLPHGVIMNILEVIDKILKSDIQIGDKAKKLRIVAQRVVQTQPPKYIKLAFQQMLLILDQDQEENDIKSLQTALTETQNRLREADERIRAAEEIMRNTEEQRRSEEQQKRDAQEQLRIKDDENQRLQAEIGRFQPQTGQQQQQQNIPAQQTNFNWNPSEQAQQPNRGTEE